MTRDVLSSRGQLTLHVLVHSMKGGLWLSSGSCFLPLRNKLHDQTGPKTRNGMFPISSPFPIFETFEDIDLDRFFVFSSSHTNFVKTFAIHNDALFIFPIF